jgi:hypothetical protein
MTEVIYLSGQLGTLETVSTRSTFLTIFKRGQTTLMKFCTYFRSNESRKKTATKKR